MANKKGDARAKRIIKLYNSGKTLREVGTIVGLTKERVRQIMLSYGAVSRCKSFKCPKCKKLGNPPKKGRYCKECIVEKRKEKRAKYWATSMVNGKRVFHLRCKDCKRTDRRQQALGLCSTCYSRRLYKLFPEKKIENCKRYRDRNLEACKKRCRDYYKNNKKVCRKK